MEKKLNWEILKMEFVVSARKHRLQDAKKPLCTVEAAYQCRLEQEEAASREFL